MPRKKSASPYSRDWDRLRLEWASSGLTVAKFARSKGLPYSTTKRQIDAKKRDAYLEAAKPEETEFRKGIESLQARIGDVDRAVHLRGVQDIVRDIFLEACDAYFRVIRANAYLRPAEVGRLALTAGEQLREIRREIENFPSKDELVEWPLLRGFDPLPGQRDFVLDFPSTLRIRGEDIFIQAFVAGIGAGKTRSGAEKWGKYCELNRGTPLGVYGPTYRMLEDVTKREFIEACVRKQIPFIHKPSEDTVTLWGDTEVQFRSMEKPDRLRGPNLAAAWIDEPFQVPSREAFDIIAGRVRHPGARERGIMMTGTADGFNWGYDVCVVDAIKNKVKVYTGKTSDNIHLPPGFFDYLVGLYDKQLALQELAGQFVNVWTGRAYYEFTRDVHVVPEKKLELNPDLPIILCCDFNVVPMHWVIAQSYRTNGDETTYCLDEIFLERSSSTAETAREFVERYGKHRAGVRIYGDAAGQHKNSTAATRTDYEILEEALEVAQMFGVERNIGASNPLHSERVQDVNARFRNARGKIHLYVSDRCRHLIQDFERQGFVPGTKQLDKSDPQIGHGADAVGYYVNREHAIRRMRAGTMRKR